MLVLSAAVLVLVIDRLCRLAERRIPSRLAIASVIASSEPPRFKILPIGKPNPLVYRAAWNATVERCNDRARAPSSRTEHEHEHEQPEHNHAPKWCVDGA